MTKFNINWNNVLVTFLPPIWKEKEFNANVNLQWLVTLTKPLRQLYNTVFVPFRDAVFYDILHNGQKLSLEHYINTLYGYSFSTTTQNSIYLEDVQSNIEAYLFQFKEWGSVLPSERIHLYQKDENISLFLFKNKELLIDTNFNVVSPNAVKNISFNYEGKVNSILKRYIPSGFSAEFIYY